MALRVPNTVKPNGKIIQHRGSENAAGRRFVASDIVGTKLLDSMNELRKEVGETLIPLSTGETSPIYFEDVTVDAIGTPFRLNHNLKRRVRWSVVDWLPAVVGQAHQLERATDSTDTVLLLRSYKAGVVTLRVW